MNIKLTSPTKLYIFSFIPILIWLSYIFIYYFKLIDIPLVINTIIMFIGWGTTAFVVTNSFDNLGWLTHKRREFIATVCFINFLLFFIYKEFRETAGNNEYLKIQYAITELFMAINLIYFSPILMRVFEENRKKR